MTLLEGAHHGLFTRRPREVLVETEIQTDAREPTTIIREVPVRMEVPIEAPSRETALHGEFEPMPGTFLVTQFGEQGEDWMWGLLLRSPRRSAECHDGSVSSGAAFGPLRARLRNRLLGQHSLCRNVSASS